MRRFIILALCLGAVFADHLESSRDFFQKHYDEHRKTVEEAKRKYGIDGNGMRSGMSSGMHTGMSSGMHSGMYNGLSTGMHSGLSSGMHSGISSGTHSGLSTGVSSGFGHQYAASSGLQSLISETERLARLQAQGISTGTVNTGATSLNWDNWGGSTAGGSGAGVVAGGCCGNTGVDAGLAVDTASRGGFGGGLHSKQWESSSKWSTKSEVGPDGQVKTFKEISTGESEQYDINGKRTGYKAATSTLDDNGKVSSYSIHS